jgi:hypothetical protein
MNMTIHDAIHFLEAKGFLVKSYGFPETESMERDPSIAETYRVIQGDFDTGMINPTQLLEVATRMQGGH